MDVWKRDMVGCVNLGGNIVRCTEIPFALEHEKSSYVDHVLEFGIEHLS